MWTPPITEDERLYRRILPGGWYKNGLIKPIPQRYFMPREWRSPDRPGDPDGLSVDRALLVQSLEHAATRPDNNKKAHLAEFGVTDVYLLALSVIPKPLQDNVAHAVIPELNSIDRRDPVKAMQMEEWAIALRDKARIVYEARTL